MDVIVYHDHCPDGWAAAYIASKKYPEATLMPRDHGLEPPYDELAGKDVLVLDFSWRTREQNDKMAAITKSFRILDHHKSAREVLEGAPYATFDMERSGAGLAWDYLFGKDAKQELTVHEDGSFSYPLPQTRPWYVDYVEDRDLWNWKLDHSKEVCAYLGTLEFTKEAWDNLELMAISSAVHFGRGALAHINHYVREAVKQAVMGVFEGYNTAVANLPYLNCSEVGNELAKTHAVSLTYFERADQIIQFSLRSIGDIDVSVIAKKYEGGGHKNAAGFQLPYLKGRQLVDKILSRPTDNISKTIIELKNQGFDRIFPIVEPSDDFKKKYL